MYAYLLNIVLIFFWAYIFLWREPLKNGKKIYCTIVSAQWIILSGLRHLSVGADTYAYKINHFDKIINTPWSTLWNNLWNTYFGNLDMKDPGYALVQKIFQIFSTNYQLFLIFITLIFTIPLGIFIYKNSKEPCMSFLIYSCLFYSFFAITGHRQTIATALVMLIGYKFIKERKLLPFIILSIVAFTIHKSSICFLPFYFLAKKKITIKYNIVIIISFVAMVIYRHQALTILNTLTGYEYEEFSSSGAWNFSLVYIVILIFIILRYKELIKNEDISIWYNAVCFAALFIPLVFVNPSIMRVVQYFSMFIMLMVPEIINQFIARDRKIVYMCAAMLLIGLFVRNNPQYLFFWQ